MSKKVEKAKEPLKDVTGKELSEEALKDVAGGMRPRGGGAGATCSCVNTDKFANSDAAENPH